jgi:hypothetical protein
MKSYLKKNNLHYFTFFSNSEKCIKAVIRHLPPDMQAKDIPNSLENFGFNVIKVMQMMVTRKQQTNKPTWQFSGYPLLL